MGIVYQGKETELDIVLFGHKRDTRIQWITEPLLIAR
jgi:hypothetical protein